MHATRTNDFRLFRLRLLRGRKTSLGSVLNENKVNAFDNFLARWLLDLQALFYELMEIFSVISISDSRHDCE
jgi:hypothetical protein